MARHRSLGSVGSLLVSEEAEVTRLRRLPQATVLEARVCLVVDGLGLVIWEDTDSRCPMHLVLVSCDGAVEAEFLHGIGSWCFLEINLLLVFNHPVTRFNR